MHCHVDSAWVYPIGPHEPRDGWIRKYTGVGGNVPMTQSFDGVLALWEHSPSQGYPIQNQGINNQAPSKTT